MRTFDKVFSGVFTALAVMTFVAGCCGATHQFALAGICFVMALMMYPHKSESNPYK